MNAAPLPRGSSHAKTDGSSRNQEMSSRNPELGSRNQEMSSRNQELGSRNQESEALKEALPVKPAIACASSGSTQYYGSEFGREEERLVVEFGLIFVIRPSGTAVHTRLSSRAPCTRVHRARAPRARVHRARVHLAHVCTSPF